MLLLGSVKKPLPPSVSVFQSSPHHLNAFFLFPPSVLCSHKLSCLIPSSNQIFFLYDSPSCLPSHISYIYSNITISTLPVFRPKGNHNISLPPHSLHPCFSWCLFSVLIFHPISISSGPLLQASQQQLQLCLN